MSNQGPSPTGNKPLRWERTSQRGHANGALTPPGDLLRRRSPTCLATGDRSQTARRLRLLGKTRSSFFSAFGNRDKETERVLKHFEFWSRGPTEAALFIRC